jgi:hypothetical protein
VLRDLEAVIHHIVATAFPPLKGEGDHAQHGGGVSAYPNYAASAATLTPLRQASPATSPHGGGLE